MSIIKKGPFTWLSSNTIYQNPWLELRQDEVIRPDGHEGIFGIVTIKDGVAILPVDENQQVWLGKEYKYAQDAELLGSFAGGIDNDETPLQAAHRELVEESGLVAKEMIDLGQVSALTSLVQANVHLFLALGISQAAIRPEADDQVEPIAMSLDDAVQAVMETKIKSAVASLLILKAWHYLNKK